MNIIEKHKNLYTQKYIKQMTELCKTFFENHLNRTPTYEEVQAFTYGHFCGINKVYSKDEMHQII